MLGTTISNEFKSFLDRRQVERYTYDQQWRSTWVDSDHFRAWSVGAARDALRDGCGAGTGLGSRGRGDGKDVVSIMQLAFYL